jgi:hypothetical protein
MSRPFLWLDARRGLLGRFTVLSITRSTPGLYFSLT